MKLCYIIECKILKYPVRNKQTLNFSTILNCEPKLTKPILNRLISYHICFKKSDTQNIDVNLIIIIKFEQCGFTVMVKKMQVQLQSVDPG